MTISNQRAELGQDFPAVLFDLDGTLVDAYLAITNSVNHLRCLRGLSELSVNEIRPRVGRGLTTLLQEVGSGDVGGDLAIYKDHYSHNMMAGTKLLPGARELVSYLREKNRLLAICSNKDFEFVSEVLRRLELDKQFDAVIGPEHVARRKPAPDMLLEAARQLRVEPSKALYIGDMSIDVRAGRAAGMTVWVVATGSETVQSLQQARPDCVFANLAEIQKTLS